MGRAREIMDLLTDAITAGDRDALGRLYAPEAVAETPDAGRLEGREAIVDYLTTYKPAFPDMSWEGVSQYEFGDTAVDEGYFVGTHSGVLPSSGGDVLPTGRRVRVRECDLVTVSDGVAVSHRFYYDQFDFMSQLGLVESDSRAPADGAGAVPGPRVGSDQPAGAPVR
ncbi:MAG: ester cyclase [Actinomycetes bacterium]